MLPESESRLLDVRDLSVGYGRLAVVHGVNMCVDRGEVVCLLGANGAGKSTTLRALAGLVPQQGGEVVWLGRAVQSPCHVRYREGMAYVSEERSVVFKLSVEDNLRLGRGSVSDALEVAPELRPLLKRRAGLLSGGEQQILTLARALASKPQLLIADELSVGLAPLIVERLLAVARSAAREGVGVLLVEQHVQRALAISDRAYVMRRGRIVLEGRCADLRKQRKEIESAYLHVLTDAGPDGVLS
jgi:branched-chain amino acid transport system ATP-binding protein